MTDWWQQPLNELDDAQWEALCDGCAKCCLHKLEDADSGEIFYTKVRCQLLDESSCRCSNYSQRSILVPDCIELAPGTVGGLDWLPSTCAYRLRANGEPLPDWHYLVSGSRETVHAAGISIRGRSVSDEFVHPDGYDEHVITWVE